jgi:Flp pilus assembly protein TadG
MRGLFRVLRKSSSRAEAGAAAVEFAIVVPLLLLLLFGIFDYGRFFLVQMALTSGAQEGVRASVLGQSASNSFSAAVDSVPASVIALAVLGQPETCAPATLQYRDCISSGASSNTYCYQNPATGISSVNLTLSFTWIASGALWFFNSPLQPQTVTTTAKAKCNG